MIIAYVPVDWFVEAADWRDMPSYRNCDLCGDNAATDAIAGLPIEQFRRFTKQIGGQCDGRIVCEHCLGKCQGPAEMPGVSDFDTEQGSTHDS